MARNIYTFSDNETAGVRELDCLLDNSAKAMAKSALYEMTGEKKESTGITTREEEKPSRNDIRNALRGEQ